MLLAQDPFYTFSSTSILRIDDKVIRSQKNTHIFPNGLQTMTHNAEHLLRMYGFGAVKFLWTKIYCSGLQEQLFGKFSSTREHSKSSFFYNANEPKSLAKFLNRHLTQKERLEDSQELSFIVARLRDCWVNFRNNDFIVLDLVSILESLLLSNRDGELKFRLSVLTASLIGKSKVEKKSIHHSISKAYDLRSAVAHCAQINPKNKLSNDEIQKLGELTIKVIKLALKNGVKSFKDKLLKIEECIY